MRVTEGHLLDITSGAVSQARNRTATVTEEMSSGLAVEKPSDNLAAWTEAQRGDVRTDESKQRGNAIASATNNLQLTDGALGAIGTTLDSARSLAVEAANGTLSAGQRAATAVSINAMRDTILGQANIQGADGQYLLAGSQGGLAPFDSLGNYSGDSKQLSISVSESQTATASVSGSVLTASSGVNVIGVLNNLSTALAANDSAGISTALGDLTTAVAQVARGRQSVGEAEDTLQQVDDARTAFEQQLSSRNSDLVDVDAVQGATDLASAKNALDTATAVAAQIVQMTSPSNQQG